MKDDDMFIVLIGIMLFVLVVFAGAYTAAQSNKRDAIEKFNVCAEKIEPEKCMQFLGEPK